MFADLRRCCAILALLVSASLGMPRMLVGLRHAQDDQTVCQRRLEQAQPAALVSHCEQALDERIPAATWSGAARQWRAVLVERSAPTVLRGAGAPRAP
ncbi:MAG: hypothetical protein ACOCXA_07670 [Planctomycetota bacterium]